MSVEVDAASPSARGAGRQRSTDQKRIGRHCHEAIAENHWWARMFRSRLVIPERNELIGVGTGVPLIVAVYGVPGV
jgi:hypothetical protein